MDRCNEVESVGEKQLAEKKWGNFVCIEQALRR